MQFQTISIQRCSPQEGLEFSWGGGGSVRPKNLDKCMELDWNFLRGGGFLRKYPFCRGGIDIFRNHTFCAAAYLAASAFCKPQQFCSLLVNQGSSCTYTE